MRILDEERRYLQSHAFETSYNICRSMIEAYPLAGVLGTILAIGGALHGGGNAQKTVTDIVQFFGDAIWTTFVGLFAAIGLMFINSILEPRVQRLHQSRDAVRDAVHRVKRELSQTSGAQTSGDRK